MYISYKKTISKFHAARAGINRIKINSNKLFGTATMQLNNLSSNTHATKQLSSSLKSQRSYVGKGISTIKKLNPKQQLQALLQQSKKMGRMNEKYNLYHHKLIQANKLKSRTNDDIINDLKNKRNVSKVNHNQSAIRQMMEQYRSTNTTTNTTISYKKIIIS